MPPPPHRAVHDTRAAGRRLANGKGRVHAAPKVKAAPPLNHATNDSTNIPHPGVTSFNTRSLSTHAKGERKARVVKFIRQLTTKSHVVCLQETNLGSLDKRALTEETT